MPADPRDILARVPDGYTGGVWQVDARSLIVSPEWRDPDDLDDDGTGWEVAECTGGRAEADAALIALAPDLVSALRSLTAAHAELREMAEEMAAAWEHDPDAADVADLMTAAVARFRAAFPKD